MFIIVSGGLPVATHFPTSSVADTADTSYEGALEE